MKVALAGAGDVGRYFVEEFAKSTHALVLLTRDRKTFSGVDSFEQRITDYTVDSLTTHLNDCDVVVSTLGGPTSLFVEIHLAILEACRRSKKCKRFIPSEWTVNIEDFPDQPLYHVPLRPHLRMALREQKEVEYTMVCNGWFADYVVPANRRHLKDIGRAWVADHEGKVFEFYGDGRQSVSLTSVRDVARVALALLDAPRWTEYTHVAAQTVTYRHLFEVLKKRDPGWSTKTLLFRDALKQTMKPLEDLESIYEDNLRLMGFTMANIIPEEKRLVWGEGVLKGIKARTVEELLDEADRNANTIL
jgi:nucleoside-diphosphate-sugar epimerase